QPHGGQALRSGADHHRGLDPLERRRHSLNETAARHRAVTQIGPTMNPANIVLTVAFLSAVGVTPALAECQIADAKLEEAILQKPELRDPANRQSVRDLRSLRDAAFTLWSFGRHADCERLLANIRELIAGPAMGSLGDNDEDEAERQMEAREPKVQRGAARGRRDEKG